MIPRLRVFVVSIVVGSFGIGLYCKRDAAGEAIHELTKLRWQQLLLLGLVLSAHKSVHATLLWVSLPGMRFRRAVVVNEVYTGCANATVGGFAVGTGVKASMLRSHGVKEFLPIVSGLVSLVLVQKRHRGRRGSVGRHPTHPVGPAHQVPGKLLDGVMKEPVNSFI